MTYIKDTDNLVLVSYRKLHRTRSKHFRANDILERTQLDDSLQISDDALMLTAALDARTKIRTV